MPNGIIRFSEFELDLGRYELRRGDRALKLEKIPFDVLLLLVEAEGQLLTREQIIERVWGKDVFVDTEHGINTAIRKIRQALKDDPDQPRFVQTVTGRGYRFVAPVIAETKVPSNGDRPIDQAALEISTAVHSATRRTVTGGRIAAALAVLLAIATALVGINFRGWRDRIWSRSAKPTIQSLAVLPLENLSGDPAQDYFADGMTDELITMLAKNSGVRVISRTSVMQYKKAQRPIRDIARELGVDGIVEGSVERSGSRVHLNAQLIYATEDRHLWAETYDRDLDDLGPLPSELARTIAKQVGQTVAPILPEPKRITPAAHDAYLLGRYYWFAENDTKSREYFEKAIALQSDYAAAWSGLADSLLLPGFNGKILRDRAVGPGGEAARKALALDNSSAEAHNTMAAFSFFYMWDWQKAEQESARAVELNPGLAEAHHLRSYVLQALHRTDESLQEQKKAMELDPFARPWAMIFALMHARRFDAALAEARMRAEAQPNDPLVRGYLSDAYMYKGMEKEAAQQMEISLQLSGEKEDALHVHEAYARGGMKAVLEWEFNDRRKKYRKGFGSPLGLAADAAVLKRKEDTLRYLEQAYEERDLRLAHIQYLPYLDFVHSDPRYQTIVMKMGLPPVPDSVDKASQ
ncbi:MAG TPA: winged helix-turn-helix domain-containing protein [Terriglobales bacterium]|nr:winged helix-turn-helix domain-containing protein [Terriglobales bacterium]